MSEAITKPYVDFSYYQQSYHGTLLGSAEFQNVEIEAEAYVEAVTFGRIQKLDEVPDCVKMAICAAAEEMHRYKSSRESNVRSESNDGYSISYGDAVNDADCEQSMHRRVKKYIVGTGLMYRGWLEAYDCEQ